MVYQGIDSAGVVRYVGTEREAAKRFADHLNSIGTGKELLQYGVVRGLEGLSKIEARMAEQLRINLHGLGKNGCQVLNKINSIAEKYWAKYGIK